MASARTPGICDRCLADWGGKRRLCLACRQALRPFAEQYKEQNALKGVHYHQRLHQAQRELLAKQKHDEALRRKHRNS